MGDVEWTDEARGAVVEVAREFNEADIHDRQPDRGSLYAELIQVVAMAGAWADAVRFATPDATTEEK